MEITAGYNLAENKERIKKRLFKIFDHVRFGLGEMICDSTLALLSVNKESRSGKPERDS